MVVPSNLNFGGGQVPLQGLDAIIAAKIQKLSQEEQAKAAQAQAAAQQEIQKLELMKRDQKLKEQDFELKLQQKDMDELWKQKNYEELMTRPEREQNARADQIQAAAQLDIQKLELMNRDQSLKEQGFGLKLQQKDIDELWKQKNYEELMTRPDREQKARAAAEREIIPVKREAAREEAKFKAGLEVGTAKAKQRALAPGELELFEKKGDITTKNVNKQQAYRLAAEDKLINARGDKKLGISKELATYKHGLSKSLEDHKAALKNNSLSGLQTSYTNSLNEIDALNKFSLQKADEMLDRIGNAYSKKEWNTGRATLAKNIGVSVDVLNEYNRAVRDPADMAQFRDKLTRIIRNAGGQNSVNALIQKHTTIVDSYVKKQQENLPSKLSMEDAIQSYKQAHEERNNELIAQGQPPRPMPSDDQLRQYYLQKR